VADIVEHVLGAIEKKEEKRAGKFPICRLRQEKSLPKEGKKAGSSAMPDYCVSGLTRKRGGGKKKVRERTCISPFL